MRYFLHMSYLGTHYHGWQWQPNVSKTIEQTVCQTLQKILHNPSLKLTGCGRTDAGVHASQYFAQFDNDLISNSNFLSILNYNLPVDIRCHEVINVAPNAHARYDVVNRTYAYIIHHTHDPFRTNRSWYIPSFLDLDKMSKMAEIIRCTNDFSWACRSPDKHNTTNCNLQKIEIRLEKNKTIIRFTADRFLRSMIRILVYDLVSVGQSKIEINEITNLIQNKSFRDYIRLAPPEGLYLSKVLYPYINIDPLISEDNL